MPAHRSTDVLTLRQLACRTGGTAEGASCLLQLTAVAGGVRAVGGAGTSRSVVLPLAHTPTARSNPHWSYSRHRPRHSRAVPPPRRLPRVRSARPPAVRPRGREAGAGGRASGPAAWQAHQCAEDPWCSSWSIGIRPTIPRPVPFPVTRVSCTPRDRDTSPQIVRSGSRSPPRPRTPEQPPCSVPRRRCHGDRCPRHNRLSGGHIADRALDSDHTHRESALGWASSVE
jgi:hypothetical protein